MLPIFKKEFLQVIGYFVIRYILAIVSGIVCILLIIPAMLIIITVGLLLATIGYLAGLFTTINAAAAIIISVPFMILFLIFTIYTIVIFTIPIPVFFRYYSMELLKQIDNTYKY